MQRTETDEEGRLGEGRENSPNRRSRRGCKERREVGRTRGGERLSEGPQLRGVLF